jgi:hypothetical protein
MTTKALTRVMVALTLLLGTICSSTSRPVRSAPR